MIKVLVPRNKAARRAGFVIVTPTSRADPASWHRPPMTIASRPRAVIDAALDATGQRVATELVIEAVQRRLVTTDALQHELVRAPRHGSKQARLALEAAQRGVWSIVEFDLADLVGGSAVLPPAWPNPELFRLDGSPLPTPDLWFDDVGLALQVHSRSYHLRDLQWEATIAGDTALGEEAVVALGITPSQLSRDPAAVLSRVERTYRNLRGRPRPDVLARERRG